MYRKHLRMARGKGEVDPRPGLRSLFVERVVNLPMVHVAWDYAANTYSSIKESNRLVNFTLTNAEKSVMFVTGQAKPMVMKFEKQIQAVDDLACKGLGTLEEKVPLITKSPDEIIDDTKDLYSSAVQSRFDGILKYGNNKVKSVTDYGMSTLSIILEIPVVNSLLGSVDGALVTTENYIDYYLPPEKEGENNHIRNMKKKSTDDEPISPIDRFVRITSTIRRRGYALVVLRVRTLQDRTFDLINMPEHMLAIALQNFEGLNRYARSLWVTLNAEETTEEQQSRNFLMKQLVPVARPLAKQLVVLYISIAELIPVPAPKNISNSNNMMNNNGSHKPALLSAVNDGILRLLGLMRVAPALLPMYLYAILTWINVTKESSSSNGILKTEGNNSMNNDTVEHNHVHASDNPSDLD